VISEEEEEYDKGDDEDAIDTIKLLREVAHYLLELQIPVDNVNRHVERLGHHLELKVNLHLHVRYRVS
jgi:Mn-dependent DtxR family transcriptional regulator